jgi:hypothetical protein
MSYICMIFLLLFSFAASADDWATCSTSSDCPDSYSCEGTGHFSQCVAPTVEDPLSCIRNSDCPDGYQCPRCWGEQCFICRKKPTPAPTCPTGMVVKCGPVWRSPGYECSCRPAP